MGETVNGEGTLDCVDAFAAFRRILRPECLEDIFDPLDGAARDGIDGVIDLPSTDSRPRSALFREEGEPLGFDEVYVGIGEVLQLAVDVTKFGG